MLLKRSCFGRSRPRGGIDRLHPLLPLRGWLRSPDSAERAVKVVEVGRLGPLRAVVARSCTLLERPLGEGAPEPPLTTRPALVILLVMTSVLPLAEAKSHLSELISRVAREHERVMVTVHGRPSAVLLAVEDLEALEETIAVLSDSDTMRQLAASDAELARGEGESEDELAESMRRRRRSE